MSSIVNLNIKVGSEEVNISLADAKKLYEELKVLFGYSDKPLWPMPNTFGPVFGPTPTTIPGKDVWYTSTSYSDKEAKNVT